MTQQAGASWAAAAPPAPAWPNSPPAPAWTTVSPPPPGTAAGWSAALSQTTAQGPGWGVASPPQLEQQGARLLKRQRPDSSDQDERQLRQGWQQQQQQWQDESEQPPAQRRRRLEPTLQQHTHAQSLPPGAGQHQHWLPAFPADQQQQSQAAQQPGAPPDIDLLPADSGDVADGSDSGEAEEPLRKRLQLGGSEVRLMLRTPLPRSIPLDLPPSAAWHQAPPCHPDSLAWAVVPWSPTAPLSELAGVPAAGTSGAGASMGSPGQARRLGLRFDHERPLPGVDASASLSAAAAPGVFIEELPHPAAEGGLDAAAGGSCEAMEE